MVYLKYVENVIPLSKLINRPVVFILFPLLSILFLKTKRNDLARPVMGTIFLVYIYISSEISIEHPSVGLASLASFARPIIRHFSHTHYLTLDQYFTSFFWPDPLPSTSTGKLNFSTSLLQRFTA